MYDSEKTVNTVWLRRQKNVKQRASQAAFGLPFEERKKVAF
jgi:hypothetical protein